MAKCTAFEINSLEMSEFRQLIKNIHHKSRNLCVTEATLAQYGNAANVGTYL